MLAYREPLYLSNNLLEKCGNWKINGEQSERGLGPCVQNVCLIKSQNHGLYKVWSNKTFPSVGEKPFLPPQSA